MNRRFLLPFLLIISMMLVGCKTYTALDAKQELETPVAMAEPIETRYSVIEAQRLEQEALHAEALAQRASELEKERLQAESEARLQEIQEQNDKQKQELKQAQDELLLLNKEKTELKNLITTREAEFQQTLAEKEQLLLEAREDASAREATLQEEYRAIVAELEMQLAQSKETSQQAKDAASEIETDLSEQILLLATDLSQKQEAVFMLQETLAFQQQEQQAKETELQRQVETLQSELADTEQAMELAARTFSEQEADLLMQIADLETVIGELKSRTLVEQNTLLEQINLLEMEISQLTASRDELVEAKQNQETLYSSQIRTLEQDLLETQNLLQAERAHTITIQKELDSTEESLGLMRKAVETAQTQAAELQKALEHAEATFTQTITEIEQKVQEKERLLSATETEAYQRYIDLETAYKEGQDAYLALEDSYEQILYEAAELRALLEEQQKMYQDLEVRTARERELQTDQFTQVLKEQETVLESLKLETQLLEDENLLLKSQLEEKTLTLEEKVRLEQMREEEALRLEAERRKAQQEIQKQLQMATQRELERQAALEAEWKQIPPLEELTFPRKYATEAPVSLAKESDQLQVMLLPLNDKKWENPSQAKAVSLSIQDLGYPVILVTGHMQNVIELVKEMRLNATLVEGGAIITSFPVLERDSYGVRVQFSEQKTLRLSLANLVEHAVFESFQADEDWQSVQKELHPPRQKKLSLIIEQGSLTEPTILGASLFEPSYQDWSSFSPITYRQIDYLWPLSVFIEDSQFFDVYRTTHFSYATNTGNTYVSEKLQERFDYLFSRKLLPLSSSMLTIGGESVADAQGVSRYGLLASFLVP